MSGSARTVALEEVSHVTLPEEQKGVAAMRAEASLCSADGKKRTLHESPPGAAASLTAEQRPPRTSPPEGRRCGDGKDVG